MTPSKLSTGAIIALATTGIFLTLVTAGIISTQTIPSDGTLTTVNVCVFSDDDCTLNCTSISWGSLRPGDSTTQTVYVKNTGTVPVTLSMTANGWDPTNADDYLEVTWNQQGTVLAVDDDVTAILTLTAAAETGDLQDFNVDIVITGAE
jgi:hypothetical protein